MTWLSIMFHRRKDNFFFKFLPMQMMFHFVYNPSSLSQVKMSPNSLNASPPKQNWRLENKQMLDGYIINA